MAIAFTATVIFASVAFLVRPETRFLTVSFSWMLNVTASAASTVLLFLLFLPIDMILGSAEGFYCDPVIPWSGQVAIFGGFGIGLVSCYADLKPSRSFVYPFLLISLFWIAPFYGFFSPALFVNVVYFAKCADRDLMAIAVVVASMLTGKAIGFLVCRAMFASGNQTKI